MSRLHCPAFCLAVRTQLVFWIHFQCMRVDQYQLVTRVMKAIDKVLCGLLCMYAAALGRISRLGSRWFERHSFIKNKAIPFPKVVADFLPIIDNASMELKNMLKTCFLEQDTRLFTSNPSRAIHEPLFVFEMLIFGNFFG